MTISVAIPTFNRASMVSQAVLAALAQSIPPDEIVVADDASTDATVETIGKLAAGNSQVRLIRQIHNSGGVVNWNAGIQATRGDLIACCSDDDRFLPDHLEASASYLSEHPEIGLVHSGFVDAIETEAGEHLDARSLRPASILTKRNVIPYLIRYYDWPFHPSTIVMRRAVWEQVGPFDPRYQFADTEWFLRVVEKFPVASLARHGALNRRHAGNWSNRLGSAHLQRELFEIVDAAIARVYLDPLSKAFWRSLWRANVRVRLAATMIARLRSGHADAARAAWSGILQNTGRQTPYWIERAGLAMIRQLCAGREPRFRDRFEKVSPL